MSNQDTHLTQQCENSVGCAALQMLIKPRDRDLGGFSVRRLLPSSQQQKVGPWVFFDHMGPATFPSGSGINVRPHPHINLATVSYLFEGEILHRDSLGNEIPISPGDINLMVAGRGIVHSERERPEITAIEHRLHGLQLWLALPEADEETAPAFYHYPRGDIPKVDVDGVPVTVMMGKAYGVTSPVKTFAHTVYIEARMNAGQTLMLPEAEERAVYVVSGSMDIEETPVPTHSMAILSGRTTTCVQAQTDATIVLVGGEKLGERFLEWNFVSSRKARIDQAKEDWRAQRFDKVPGDEEEFIPLP